MSELIPESPTIVPETTPEGAPAQGQPTRRLVRYLPHAIAAVALISLSIVSILLWSEWQKRFPHLEPGRYVGRITGVFNQAGDNEIPLYIENRPGGDDLFFVVMKPGWDPQTVSILSSDGSKEGSKGYVPVLVSGPSHKLRFTGNIVGPGVYSGNVTDLTTSEEGVWIVSLVRELPPDPSEEEVQETRLWLMLSAELELNKDRIALAEKKVPSQKLEIEKLTSFITEGDKLRQKAEEKFQMVKDQLKKAQETLKSRQEEAKTLERTFDLSQRVTGMGRLVSLSRDTLEREYRWVDSLLKGQATEVSSDLIVAIQKAERMTRLKREINLEQEKITKLEDSVKSNIPTSGAIVETETSPELDD